MQWQRRAGNAVGRIAFFIRPMVLLSLMVLGISTGERAEAKDLSNRLGIGYKNQFSEDLPGVAAQYYPSPDVGVSVTLGVDTESDNSRFGLMAKLYKIVFAEDNMNFYMAAGAGLLSTENAGGQNESGFELGGYVGCEFFFAGLESLGFSVETGAAITSVSSGVRFRTVGDHPLRAGILFYF
jgi:hypothetical protein